jgi:pblA|nr:MAG TPA: tail tape measure protein [Caudoviricetes sp.]DAU88224.1 MAG TPA: tail tape measure protein [Caudoviricetes sp.]
MMATELGKAFVQIVPSANGISGQIESLINPSATGGGIGGLLGKGMMSGILNILKTVGVAKLIKDSLLEGGELQQTIGGIETLFKKSAYKVKEYAQDAYMSAGLSANEYMQNVTSFSASLLQSTAGNTNRAAEIAHMAMVDMADNANKMGTDMGSIQTAYQGFAKQNYMMLDNLKLGYAGTKTEMERLLADAKKLTGVKYDINNLADVYSAIHAIQEKMEITGTTAREASETLQGSFLSMKAAFKNTLGSLALGENIVPSLKGLAQTVTTFLIDNLIPMMLNILKSVPIASFAFLAEFLPKFAEKAMSFILKLGDDLQKWFKELPNNFVNLMTQLSQYFEKNGDSMVKVGKEFITKFLSGLLGALPNITTAILTIIGYIAIEFFKGIPEIVKFGQGIIGAIIKGVLDGWKALLTEIGKIVLSIVDEFFKLDDKFFEAGANIIKMIGDGIKSAVKYVLDSIGDLVKKIRDFLPFSPAKVGPLRDLDKLNFDIIADGINSAKKPVLSATNDLMSSVRDSLNPTSDLFIDSNFERNISANLNKTNLAFEKNKNSEYQSTTDYTSKISEILSSINTLTQEVHNQPYTQRELARKGAV